MDYPYLYDKVIVVCWLLLPVTLGSLTVPIVAPTVRHMLVGLVCCIAFNVFWLMGLSWFTRLGFNTDPGVIARVMTYDFLSWFSIGWIIRGIKGPYRPYVDPSDPADRYKDVPRSFSP